MGSLRLTDKHNRLGGLALFRGRKRAFRASAENKAIDAVNHLLKIVEISAGMTSGVADQHVIACRL